MGSRRSYDTKLHPENPRQPFRLLASECLASLILLALSITALAFFRPSRPGAAKALLVSFSQFLLWAAWLGLARRWRQKAIQFLRAFGPWIAVALSYGLMRYLVPLVHPTVYDQTLRACEEWLWGWDSAHFLRAMANERWTAFLCLLYLSVFAWLVAFFLYLILRRSRLFQRAMVGLLLLYAGGFLGYMLFPAEGPRYAFAGEWDFLDGTGMIASLTNAVVSHMGSHLDVFPSLHAAFVAYLLLWQADRRPHSLVWGFPLAVGVWFSTLYLGFHYFPDFIGGWLLGVFSFYAAPLLEEKLTALNGLLPTSQRAETPAESAA